MNGFAGAILSILLGWLRALFDNLWRLLSSDNGGSFLSFLRFHWKAVFVGLCIAGFVVDRIVYFFRWRPDYVWSTQLGRLKRRLRHEPELEDEEEPVPSYRQALPPPILPSYVPPQTPPSMMEEVPATPQDFAPQIQPNPTYRYTAPYAMEDVQPVFDEPTASWAPVAPPPAMETYHQPYANPAQDLNPGFGNTQPEPAAYLLDVQAGFAPPPALEQRYAKPPAPAPSSAQPIHPGLDVETFQQNFGLGEPPPPPPDEPEPLMKPLVDFPNTTFVPYYQTAEPTQDDHAKKGLIALARKARKLVRSDDEDHPATIRDLQSTANIKTSFHPPVLPKKPPEGGEE